MVSLSEQKCEACRVGAPLLSDEEFEALAPQIPLWRRVLKDGIQQLERQYSFNNYKETMAFANRVAEIAEDEGHHPAMFVEWGSVTVNWWTHKIKGLHHNDVLMAAKTDALLK